MSSSFFRSTCIVSIISFLILFFISAFFIPFIPGIENIYLMFVDFSGNLLTKMVGVQEFGLI